MALSIPRGSKNFFVCNSSNSPDIMPQVGTWGLSLWLEIKGLAVDECLVHANNTSDSSEFKLTLLADRTLQVSSTPSAGGTQQVSSSALSEGYRHVAVSSDGSEIALYVDGSLASTLSSGLFDTALTEMQIGRDIGGTDQANIVTLWWGNYSDSLSEAEITALYNAGVPTDPTSLASGVLAVLPFNNSVDPTTGSVELGSGNMAHFVDSGFEGSWTAPDIQLVPVIRNLDVLPSDMDMDVLMLSDSFGFTTRNRLTDQLADQIAKKFGLKIKKLLHGTDEPTFFDRTVATSIPGGGSITGTFVSDASSYEWENQHTPTQSALPFGGDQHEIYTGATPSGDILEVTVQAPTDYTGPILDFYKSDLTMSPVVRITTTNQLGAIQVSDNGINAQDISITGSGGDIKVLPPKLCQEDAGSSKKLLVSPSEGTWDTEDLNKYLDYLGTLVEDTTVEKGLSWASIAGNSWAISQHATNAQSSQPTSNVKRYTDDEIGGLLDGYQDSDRKLIFCLNIADNGNQEPWTSNWISRVETLCASKGITNYGFWLISQFTHRVSGSEDSYADRAGSETTVVQFDAIAQSREDTCHLSMYKLFDGAYFHDAPAGLDPNDENGPQRQLLNNYDARWGTTWSTDTLGVLLDATSLHLGSITGAQPAEFMGAAVAEAMYNELNSPPGGQSSARASRGPMDKQLFRRTMNALKHRFGQPVTLYTSDDSSTDYRTGVKTQSSIPTQVKHCIVLPTKIGSSLFRSISYLGASQAFASEGGGRWDQGTAVFIIDAEEARGFEPRVEDWVVHRGRRYDFKTIEKVAGGCAWLVSATFVAGIGDDRALIGVLNDMFLPDDLATVELESGACNLIDWMDTSDWSLFEACINVSIEESGSDTTSQFGTVSASQRWVGGVLAPNGKIICGPALNNGEFLAIDTNDDTVEAFAGPPSFESCEAGVLAQNGKIYFAPMYGRDIWAVDPTSNTVENFFLTIGQTQRAPFFQGAVIDANGFMYCIPLNNPHLLVFDTNTEKVVSTELVFGDYSAPRLRGGVLAADGRIYCIPGDDDELMVIDPSMPFGSQISFVSPVPSGINKWIGGVQGPNGIVYGIPNNSDDVIRIDPFDTVTYFSASETSPQYRCGAMAPNGKIYCVSNRADQDNIGIIDPATDTMTDFAGPAGYSHRHLVLAQNGKLYGVPFDSTYVLKIDPASAATLSPDIVLSAFYNKY